jgi:hypothetical protein
MLGQYLERAGGHLLTIYHPIPFDAIDIASLNNPRINYYTSLGAVIAQSV